MRASSGSSKHAERRRVSSRERIRRYEINPIGDIEIPSRNATHASVAVLPDHRVGLRVNDDDAIVQVIVEENVAVRQREREGRMIQTVRPWGGIAPESLAGLVEDDDLTGQGVVDSQVSVRADLVGVRRISHAG